MKTISKLIAILFIALFFSSCEQAEVTPIQTANHDYSQYTYENAPKHEVDIDDAAQPKTEVGNTQYKSTPKATDSTTDHRPQVETTDMANPNQI
tara:strand:+ start:119 stop:400 length:282 start_codon:yes stop_codon:yes gene_type:complete